jgi:acetyl/propionyl-CoA carboxylase alpha subunit
MKLELEIEGKIMEAEFSSGEPMAQLSLEGKVYRAAVSEPEPGIFVIIFNDRVYRCTLERLPNGGIEVNVGGQRISVAANDKKHLRSNPGGSSGSGGRVILSAPMPGKVVRILLAAGAEVNAHQGVLIVEAMKMQNEVQSPKAGKIAEMRISEGQTVNGGEILAVIE